MANGKRKPMRQGQQNRRGRGRGRKVQNPLSRNYESNGPEVKIRGNASHIAEKYSALARDSLVSGDTITAENYLQHAEHYYRIIMAAQAQNAPSAGQAADGANGSGGQRAVPGEEADGSGNAQSDASVNGNEAEVQAAESSGDGDAGKSNGDADVKDTEKADAEDTEKDAQASDGAPPDNAAA